MINSYSLWIIPPFLQIASMSSTTLFSSCGWGALQCIPTASAFPPELGPLDPETRRKAKLQRRLAGALLGWCFINFMVIGMNKWWLWWWFNGDFMVIYWKSCWGDGKQLQQTAERSGSNISQRSSQARVENIPRVIPMLALKNTFRTTYPHVCWKTPLGRQACVSHPAHLLLGRSLKLKLPNFETFLVRCDSVWRCSKQVGRIRYTMVNKHKTNELIQNAALSKTCIIAMLHAGPQHQCTNQCPTGEGTYQHTPEEISKNEGCYRFGFFHRFQVFKLSLYLACCTSTVAAR